MLEGSSLYAFWYEPSTQADNVAYRIPSNCFISRDHFPVQRKSIYDWLETLADHQLLAETKAFMSLGLGRERVSLLHPSRQYANWQVVASFYDLREAKKVYDHFRDHSAFFRGSARPVLIDCCPISKGELELVS